MARAVRLALYALRVATLLAEGSERVVRASLDLLELDGAQHFPVPDGITHIVVEIGCNGHGLLWNTPFGKDIRGIRKGVGLSQEPHVLLVSFEPLLDKYATYLSIQNRGSSGRDAITSASQTSPPIGWSVPGRAVVLPYAVGSSEDYADFHVAKTDGCSSMLPINNSMKKWSGDGSRFMSGVCGSEAATRRVPVISLRTILGWFPNHKIAFVKIDAQGYDLHVALSAGDAISRIEWLELEITGNKWHLPYVGAEKCSDVMAQLAAVGFIGSRNRALDNRLCNATFHGSMTFRQNASIIDITPQQDSTIVGGQPRVRQTGTASMLRATLDLLDLSEGLIRVPDGITRIVVEIGTGADGGFLWNTPFPHSLPGIERGTPISQQKHVLLVSFEPRLDRYAAYLTLNKKIVESYNLPGLARSRVEVPTALGWSYPGRAIVLPFAVGGAIKCAKRALDTRYPHISLRSVLNWFPSRAVDYIHVASRATLGCQGHEIAQSAGDAISQVGAMGLEAGRLIHSRFDDPGAWS